MSRVILRRVALAVPALFGVTVLVFLLMQVLPGDPAAGLLSPGATPQARAIVSHELGLDKPLPVRYEKWLVNVSHGDFGYSVQRERSVGSLLKQAWWNTAVLALVTALFGLIAGTAIGIVAAIYRGRWIDRLLSIFTLAGLSVPSFWLAIILLILFSAQWHLLPASGTGVDQGGGTYQLFRHLIMPVVAGGLVTLGITARVTRASTVEAFEADFVGTLRAKGLNSYQVLWHVVKNALNPILTTSGLQIGYLLGGQVLIETIFAWPGMGLLVYNAIEARDLLVVQGAMLVIAVGFVIINLVVDLIQVAVNPSLERATA
jgi:peptide/nickel transport system permease protein